MKRVQFDDSLLKSLHAVKIFSVLTDDELRDFIKVSEILSFDENETVIQEGEKGSYLYAILHGSIKVMVKKECKECTKDIYICTIGPGDVFGEAAIFMNVERTASVLSNDSALIVRIDRKQFIGFIKKYPAVGIKILMLIIYSLLNKLREANQEIAFDRQAFVGQDDVDALISTFLDN